MQEARSVKNHVRVKIVCTAKRMKDGMICYKLCSLHLHLAQPIGIGTRIYKRSIEGDASRVGAGGTCHGRDKVFGIVTGCVKRRKKSNNQITH